jgi:hypothetical protein
MVNEGHMDAIAKNIRWGSIEKKEFTDLTPLTPHKHEEGKINQYEGIKVNKKNQSIINRFGQPLVLETYLDSKDNTVVKSYLIDHESMGCKIWTFIMFFFSIVTSFIYAILAAYRDQVDPVIQYLEFVYIIDILQKFMTTFIDPESKKKV